MYRIRVVQGDGTTLEFVTKDPGSTVTSVHREFMAEGISERVFRVLTSEAFGSVINAFVEEFGRQELSSPDEQEPR